jgi:hypothetical protein
MLRGEETQATFMVTPPLVSSLSPGSTQDFSADIVVRAYPDTAPLSSGRQPEFAC